MQDRIIAVAGIGFAPINAFLAGPQARRAPVTGPRARPD
jgi:hypothetical protein